MKNRNNISKALVLAIALSSIFIIAHPIIHTEPTEHTEPTNPLLGQGALAFFLNNEGQVATINFNTITLEELQQFLQNELGNDDNDANLEEFLNDHNININDLEYIEVTPAA